MRAIRDFVGYEMEWVKPRWFRNEYQLRVDSGEPLAYLRPRGGLRAEALLAEGNFSTRRQGFWQPKLLVTRAETQMPVATLSHVGNGGTLDFADGLTQQYVWVKSHIFSAEHFWADSAGRPVVHVYPSSWKVYVRITFEPIASQTSEIGLLTVLAGLLAILAYQESATVVAATSSAGGAG